MADRPLVAVRWAQHTFGPLIATCSACGDLSTVGGDGRHALQRIAHRHAWDAHDGDVDAEGWI